MWILKGNRKSKGFTLLEVIIALAIFAMLALPIAITVMKASDVNKTSENKQKAHLLAQEIMEEIKYMAISEIKEAKLSKGYALQGESRSDSYELLGEAEGFKVKIKINPEEVYSFPENGSIEPDNIYTVEIIKGENINLIKLENNYNINLINKEINIKYDDTKTFIQGYEIDAANSEKAIKIIFSKSTEGNFTINTENKRSYPLELFIYKSEGSITKVAINNEGGILRTYNNIYFSDEAQNSSRLYSIKIEVSHKEQVLYELLGNKTVER